MGSEGHAGSREAAARGLPAPRAARWGSPFPQAARGGPTGRNLSKKTPKNAQIPARAAGKAAPGAALLGPGPLRARQTPRHPRRRPGPAPTPPRACGPGLRGVRPPARPHLSDRFEVQTAPSAPHAQAAAPPPSAALRVSAARPAVSPWGGIGAAAAAQLGPRAAPCLHRFLGGETLQRGRGIFILPIPQRGVGREVGTPCPEWGISASGCCSAQLLPPQDPLGRPRQPTGPLTPA